MTTDLVLLSSGPWLHTGQQGWIALMTFGPVLALVGFFIYTYKRHLDRQAKRWREQSRREPGDYLDR